MTEVEKLHGLHNTGMTMHERFSLLSKHPLGRRGNGFPRGRTPRARGRGRSNPALIEAIIHQLNQAQSPFPEIPFRGRSRSRGLRRYGSEGSLHSMPGLRKVRSNSFGPINQNNKNQKWRRSNGNLSSYAGSVNGSVYSAKSTPSHGYWLRGNAAQTQNARGGGGGRGRGRGFRGRTNRGRVQRAVGLARPARGSGRLGARRTAAQAQGRRARGRGRGISRAQTPKPVPTKEELDAQLDQYMSSTKAALDKELDEYMRNAMDFD